MERPWRTSPETLQAWLPDGSIPTAISVMRPSFIPAPTAAGLRLLQTPCGLPLQEKLEAHVLIVAGQRFDGRAVAVAVLLGPLAPSNHPGAAVPSIQYFKPRVI